LQHDAIISPPFNAMIGNPKQPFRRRCEGSGTTGAKLKSHPPACGLLPGRLLRPATRQRRAGIALRSRLARVPILWSVKLDLFPSFDDPTKFVSRDWHSQL